MVLDGSEAELGSYVKPLFPIKPDDIDANPERYDENYQDNLINEELFPIKNARPENRIYPDKIKQVQKGFLRALHTKKFKNLNLHNLDLNKLQPAKPMTDQEASMNNNKRKADVSDTTALTPLKLLGKPTSLQNVLQQNRNAVIVTPTKSVEIEHLTDEKIEIMSEKEMISTLRAPILHWGTVTRLVKM